MTTAYHVRYFAHDLTRQAPPGADDQLSMSLFDAAVDLNPHQIEAAMFALKSPVSKGVILADEVGLGKTIEAGIVLCQKWAERKRRLLIICPASIRKQWSLELQEKFNLPSVVLDAKAYRQLEKTGNPRPFNQKSVVIVSFHYASRMSDEIRMLPWDLVVIDEAHKLRNAYRPSNKMGQAIRWAVEDRKKLLLTATPLQNSLLELYGLSTLIDENIFGDANAFRAQYVNAGGNLRELRQRLRSFCNRTLRNQVLEYIRYTQRHAITRPFHPSDEEHRLYQSVSAFLQQPDSYAIPHEQRHLTVLIMRKLLASSSIAIAGTLDTLIARLEVMRDGIQAPVKLADTFIENEEFDEELLDEILDGEDGEDEAEIEPANIKKLDKELEELRQLSHWAKNIGVDAKTKTLVSALVIGFERMKEMGASRKALIFTESRRTQDYLVAYLEANGHKGKVVMFNGTNSGPDNKVIYDNWLEANKNTGRSTGSRAIDMRTALIEHFRDSATIMVATEAAAEGINLQFCALVVNYDLPWNPQRVEQRIGRCHRYGQKHDVVVINFLNERNEADQRVFQLLNEKFHLFSGVFGSSDEVLGTLESGIDFEKRILAIYQECRTPEQIETAFKQLQEDMDEKIKSRLADTREKLLEHFDEDVHARLRMRLEDAKLQLDRFGQRFWSVTKHILDDRAKFTDHHLAFDLVKPPISNAEPGRYHLISKNQPTDERGTQVKELGAFLYRLSHPLGEHVIDTAKALDTPFACVSFNISNHPAKIAVIEELKGRAGYLTLNQLVVDSFEREEYLLFSGLADDGASLDQEVCSKLFNCAGTIEIAKELSEEIDASLQKEAQQHAKATISRSLEANNKHFNEARERLEQWADDKVLGIEKALADTKVLIKARRREARLAQTLEEQRIIQDEIKKLERRQRRQRREIFDAEDEIAEKRDELIEALEKRLSQRTNTQTLFTIRWQVV